MTDYVTLLQRRLLQLLDEEKRAVAADAYQRGRSDGYQAGWLAGIAHVKRTETGLVRALERTATRWVVYGQKRTRQTFGDPHPRDYPGQLLP